MRSSLPPCCLHPRRCTDTRCTIYRQPLCVFHVVACLDCRSAVLPGGYGGAIQCPRGRCNERAEARDGGHPPPHGTRPPLARKRLVSFQSVVLGVDPGVWLLPTSVLRRAGDVWLARTTHMQRYSTFRRTTRMPGWDLRVLCVRAFSLRIYSSLFVAKRPATTPHRRGPREGESRTPGPQSVFFDRFFRVFFCSSALIHGHTSVQGVWFLPVHPYLDKKSTRRTRNAGGAVRMYVCMPSQDTALVRVRLTAVSSPLDLSRIGTIGGPTARGRGGGILIVGRNHLII